MKAWALVLYLVTTTSCSENKAVTWAQTMYPGVLTCTPLETSSGCQGGDYEDIAACRTKTETWQCVYVEGRGGDCKKVGNIPAELQ